MATFCTCNRPPFCPSIGDVEEKLIFLFGEGFVRFVCLPKCCVVNGHLFFSVFVCCDSPQVPKTTTGCNCGWLWQAPIQFCKRTWEIGGGNFETRSMPEHVGQEESSNISKCVPILLRMVWKTGIGLQIVTFPCAACIPGFFGTWLRTTLGCRVFIGDAHLGPYPDLQMFSVTLPRGSGGNRQCLFRFHLSFQNRWSRGDVSRQLMIRGLSKMP